jgi:hypothetical protein
MTVTNLNDGADSLEEYDRRRFRAEVRNEFLQMRRVVAITNLCPVSFLEECADTIDAYYPCRESALWALGDDFETLSRWKGGAP